MRILPCLLVVVLALALVDAAPKSIEKKSLLEDAKLEKKTNLKLDEESKEKDRAKKSAASFIVEIKPTANQASSDCKDGSGQLQTVSVVQQPSAQLQTLNVVAPAQPQLQTVSVVPTSQPVQQTSNLVLPTQPAVQPVHTLHILQSVPQPCAQPAQVSFVQPQPQPQTLNIVQTPSKPEPAPKPAPAPEPVAEKIVEVKPEPQQPKPSQVVNIIQPAQPVPEPTETVSYLPVEPQCEEQVMYVMAEPEPQPQLAALVQVPQCYHQQQPLYTECNCHPKNLAYVSAGSGGAVVKDRHTGPSFKTHHHLHHAHHHGYGYPGSQPVYVYSTSFTQPMLSAPVAQPMMSVPAIGKPPQYMIQYNPVQSPVTMGRSAAHELVGDSQKGRTSTTINLGAGLHSSHFHGHSPYAMKGYGSGLPHGITINSHPHHYGGSVSPWYRQSGTGVTVQEGSINSPGASEAMDMIQAMGTKKVPRETDPNVLAAEEADKSIKEIIEPSSPRTARSDADAKIEKIEESANR